MSKLILLEKTPKCPKCNVPMSLENFRHRCEKKCCEHISNDEGDIIGFTMGHLVYRCPKCYDLYYTKEK